MVQAWFLKYLLSVSEAQGFIFISDLEGGHDAPTLIPEGGASQRVFAGITAIRGG